LTDFNCTPNDATYSLLTGQPLSDDHKGHLSRSRVTHVSVDPTVPISPVNSAEEEDGSEESDPDKVITNARSATEADGLLNDTELVSLFAQGHILRSAYDEGLSRIDSNSSRIALYGGREHLPTTQPGFHEPSYTCYTHYWKSVLGELDLCRRNHLDENTIKITYFSSHLNTSL
jgi:RNA exonuclease NGL2